jgi:hypothetical protein
VWRRSDIESPRWWCDGEWDYSEFTIPLDSSLRQGASEREQAELRDALDRQIAQYVARWRARGWQFVPGSDWPEWWRDGRVATRSANGRQSVEWVRVVMRRAISLREPDDWSALRARLDKHRLLVGVFLGCVLTLGALALLAAGGSKYWCEADEKRALRNDLARIYAYVGAVTWSCMQDGRWSACGPRESMNSQARFADAVDRAARSGAYSSSKVYPYIYVYLLYVVDERYPPAKGMGYRGDALVGMGAAWAPEVTYQPAYLDRFAATVCGQSGRS